MAETGQGARPPPLPPRPAEEALVLEPDAASLSLPPPPADVPPKLQRAPVAVASVPRAAPRQAVASDAGTDPATASVASGTETPMSLSAPDRGSVQLGDLGSGGLPDMARLQQMLQSTGPYDSLEHTWVLGDDRPGAQGSAVDDDDDYVGGFPQAASLETGARRQMDGRYLAKPDTDDRFPAITTTARMLVSRYEPVLYVAFANVVVAYHAVSAHVVQTYVVPSAVTAITLVGEDFLAVVHSNILHVFHARSGALWLTSDVHSGAIIAVASSPGDGDVFTAGRDGCLRRWSSRRRRRPLDALDALHVTYRNTLAPHASPIRAMALGGTIVYTGCDDACIYAYDGASVKPEPVRVLRGHGAPVTALALAQRQLLLQFITLVSADEAGVIRVWDTTTGTCQRVLRAHGDIVRCLAIDMNYVYSAGGSTTSINPDFVLRQWLLTQHVKPEQFSLQLYDSMRSSKETKVAQNAMQAHTADVVEVATAGRTVYSASADGTTHVWDGASASLLASLPSFAPLQALAALRDGRVWTIAADGVLRYWDTARAAGSTVGPVGPNAERALREVRVQAVAPIQLFDVAPTGQYCAVRRATRSVPGDRVDVLTLPGMQAVSRFVAPDRDTVSVVRWLTREVLMLGCVTGRIAVMTRNAAASPPVFAAHTAQIVCLDVTPHVVVERPAPGTDHRRSTEQPAATAGVESHRSAAAAAAAASDYTVPIVVSGDADGVVLVWDPLRVTAGDDAAAVVHQLPGHKGRVTGLASRPGGAVYTGGDDGCICVWDTTASVDSASARLRHRLRDASGAAVTALVAMSAAADGRRARSRSGRSVRVGADTLPVLYSAHVNGCIFGWDPDRGTQLLSLSHDSAAIVSLACHRDVLYAGTADGALLTYDTLHAVAHTAERLHVSPVAHLIPLHGRVYSAACGVLEHRADMHAAAGFAAHTVLQEPVVRAVPGTLSRTPAALITAACTAFAVHSLDAALLLLLLLLVSPEPWLAPGLVAGVSNAFLAAASSTPVQAVLLVAVSLVASAVLALLLLLHTELVTRSYLNPPSEPQLRPALAVIRAVVLGGVSLGFVPLLLLASNGLACGPSTGLACWTAWHVVSGLIALSSMLLLTLLTLRVQRVAWNLSAVRRPLDWWSRDRAVPLRMHALSLQPAAWPVLRAGTLLRLLLVLMLVLLRSGAASSRAVHLLLALVAVIGTAVISVIGFARPVFASAAFSSLAFAKDIWLLLAAFFAILAAAVSDFVLLQALWFGLGLPVAALAGWAVLPPGHGCHNWWSVRSSRSVRW